MAGHIYGGKHRHNMLKLAVSLLHFTLFYSLAGAEVKLAYLLFQIGDESALGAGFQLTYTLISLCEILVSGSIYLEILQGTPRALISLRSASTSASSGTFRSHSR